MRRLEDLKVKLFADGADMDGMREMAKNPFIRGFTTNPTLMRKAGIKDYAAFARSILVAIDDRPISFEVFDDDFDAMVDQGREIASWGKNVNVKVPVTNTRGEFSGKVIRTLAKEGIALNITAVMTLEQVLSIATVLEHDVSAIVSVFAGRIADTGTDPIPLMQRCKAVLAKLPKAELLWASPREVLNIFQADEVGCDIITATSDIIAKLALHGKNLTDYSRETVQMFYRDAAASSYTIKTRRSEAA